MRADLIVIDDRKGTAAAVERGFETTGTLGVLLLAAERGFVDLEAAFNRLKATTFRHTEAMLHDAPGQAQESLKKWVFLTYIWRHRRASPMLS
jgi:predicted nucleic acid-binding protein